MEDIFESWKLNSKNKENENYQFIRSLKMRDSKKIDRLASKVHNEIFNKIDCLDCGNCCRNSRPVLNQDDIEQIAEFLKISIREVKNKFLKMDEEKDWVTNDTPCPFLNGSDNKCTIYEHRPTDCREFPHTNKKDFSSRSYQTSYNTTLCPATYEIVERLKSII